HCQPESLSLHAGLPILSDAISSLTAEGGTGLFQALKEADDVLRGTQADLKELVLVDDGQADDVKYDDLLAKMRQDKIGMSIVSIDRQSTRLNSSHGSIS